MAHGLLRLASERLGYAEQDLHSLRNRGFGDLRVLDTDSYSSINRVLRGAVGYVYSQYRPDRQNGDTLSDGSLNIDLLSIPCEAGHFDVIMTSDVMEHVEDDMQAHGEIYRCLASGGTYLFTVPYDPCMLATRRLTQTTGLRGRSFVLDRHIHGDPHSGAGIPAHRIYGYQISADLERMGYQMTFLSIEDPSRGIFGGDLFFASKGT